MAVFRQFSDIGDADGGNCSLKIFQPTLAHEREIFFFTRTRVCVCVLTCRGGKKFLSNIFPYSL